VRCGRQDRIDGISPRAKGSIAKFISSLDAWTGSGTFLGAGVSESLSELVERVIKESGLERMYKAQAEAGKSEADAERLDNLDELVSSAHEFELEFDPSADPAAEGIGLEARPPALLSLLRAYLESVALVADADAVDADQGAVTMMTLHAAKGLEFPIVAMIGLEEGLLPHSRARESDAALEEERRLAFVGITRAMRKLHISSAKYRTLRGISERTIPSRFLSELGRLGLRSQISPTRSAASMRARMRSCATNAAAAVGELESRLRHRGSRPSSGGGDGAASAVRRGEGHLRQHRRQRPRDDSVPRCGNQDAGARVRAPGADRLLKPSRPLLGGYLCRRAAFGFLHRPGALRGLIRHDRCVGARVLDGLLHFQGFLSGFLADCRAFLSQKLPCHNGARNHE
jgi:hypothetical protein